ncbi:MAG: aldehyde:ferredoxin oxidoreductase, partial [bacterium]|nr:aldehyde:ferredoxin oxidoreductase [bacterium]
GKTSQDVVILIDGVDEKIRILEISGLPDDAYETSSILTSHFGPAKPRSISVVTTGPGAKHTLMGCLNFSWYDIKRKIVRYKQAARGGIGTVFADKGIKAIVARWDSVNLKSNQPADKIALKEVSKRYSREIVELDPKQNDMARVGTTHIVTIMNDFDLLPVKNFQYGRHPQAPNLGQNVYRRLFDPGFDGCWMGCTVACSHGIKNFIPLTGPYKGKKVFVDGPEYETIAGCGSNLGIFDPHTVAEMNFYCDAYGLDTISVGTSIAFVMECFERGLITETDTGGMDLSFGNRPSALALVHQMAKKEGFGEIVGQGVRKMKGIFVEKYGVNAQILQ